MKKPATVFDVAEYFIALSNKEKKKISNKKLQKIVYYAQAWTLVWTGKPLFSERIEAWIHGPAVPELYQKYKHFGFNPIVLKNPDSPYPFSKEIRDILDLVWKKYGRYDAQYLEFLSHQEDPWSDTRNELEFDESCNHEISHESMKKYYSEKLKRARKK